ncbi:hypothetical protein [Robertmurraya siralis]|uniref:hypothetical protein n=1 Tax=Robertmurraya siralis TaxID=77777 RepID=UPI0010F78C84|nr:hypothetical protein [Robertmurraya siralis]
METLDSPVFEVKQDSEWYKAQVRRRNDINKFFDAFEEKYGVRKGFSFYHPDYFGVYGDTETYEVFKNELVKNPTKDNWYAFKKRSKYYKEIKSLLVNIEEVSPFKAHDVLGLNNVVAGQWINGRWFYQIKKEDLVKSDEVTPIDYKEYLKYVMDNIELAKLHRG